MDHHTRKLTGLTDKHLIFEENWLEEQTINGQETFIIHGKLSYTPRFCRKCGCKNEGQIVKNGTHLTRSQLVPFRGRKTVLHLKRSRFLCRDCGSTFNAQTPLIKEKHHLSRELVYKIARELKNNRSRKEIAEDNFVSDVTVMRVLRSFANEFKPNYKYLPSVLCIDEFRSLNASDSPMSFIFMNGHTNQIIEVLESRRLAFLKTHFMRYSRNARLKVRYLVMDMNAPYAELIKAVFPNAQIVTDRFHIVQHINRTLNQFRTQVMNRFSKGKTEEDKQHYRRFKRFWRLFLKDSEELNSSDYHYDRSFRRPMTQKAIMDELLSYNEELKLAYDTCQLLLYHYRRRQTTLFFNLLDQLDKRLPEWFRKKLTFFKKYKQGITNAFKLTYNNGAVEGTNNKIKVIKRVAYGYRNFQNFRARIYFIQGLIFKEFTTETKNQTALTAA